MNEILEYVGACLVALLFLSSGGIGIYHGFADTSKIPKDRKFTFSYLINGIENRELAKQCFDGVHLKAFLFIVFLRNISLWGLILFGLILIICYGAVKT